MIESSIAETTRLLTQAYAQAERELEPSPDALARMRSVYAAHGRAIEALRKAAHSLWAMEELRWSAAMTSRAQDCEVQARRHIDALVQRARETQGGGNVSER